MRELERLIGHFNEFKDHNDRRLDKIERKIDDIYSLRWRIAGGITMLSLIGSVLFKLIFEVIAI